ncbi:MAG: tetraacyldisaccharide 4'-kinase [Phascolarctobacterium sp.]|uniref:tetraacyldisaccharide 4'-kinase n=1 Tax=Phascolarctobacterium sp. TaxID=2049039 RepID=UPI0026DDCB42|nr:tetraacyldisaccharide 4'-kinase [Phascolarctobacterium sp.]MDO4921740.1 tetraacyldisaccharide 4'-kinase [Phascolarctobacterium sp.]
MYFLYNILILIVLVVFVIPYYTYRLFTEKGFALRFKQQVFGRIKREEIAKVMRKDCVWIHGASVGEIVATSPLVKQIRKEMPDRPVLVSAFTVGGYNMAKQIIPEADAIIYFPLDLPFVAESLVKLVHPGVFMPVETELWPNFLRAIRERHIPVMMVNGRISEKSVKNYKYLYGIWDDMLNTVTRFCMQSSIDADYIAHLGAERKKIFVTGNTKFDQTYAEVTPADLEKYRLELGLRNDYPIIVAGSTHPGEEKILLESFKAVRETYPHARLVIAPRKTARADEIAKLAAHYGYETGYRSKMLEQQGERAEYPLLLIDTIGELGRIYAVGDVVFVGGSFSNTGGHNVLEPAAHAKPILVGPSMQNFKDSYALLSKVKACKMVHSKDELTSEILDILQNGERRAQMGAASLQVIKENRGADVRSIRYLKELLELTAVPAREYSVYPVNTRNLTDEGGARLRHGDAVIQYIYRIAYGPETPFMGWLLLSLLRGMSYLYEFGVCCKLSLYESGILKGEKLNCCVISIGNITVGGTGKTPTAQKVAAIIKAMGYRVVILNRGYRSHWGKELGVVSDGQKIFMTAYEAGDEAYLMAKTLPGIPVIIGKNRAVTGRYAVDKMKAEVIIMDDGYQHWQLERDLDMVLVDTLNMFGNGCVLPRGTLREPLQNLARGDLFLLTKTDQSSKLNRLQLRNIIAKYNAKAPVVESVHHPKNFVEIADWYKGISENFKELDELRGKDVMVFSAIGNPSSFEQTLSSIGLNILESVRYPDHHDYGMLEMQYINERASSLKAVAMIATAKDAVKIPTEFIYSTREIPLYILNMDICITEGMDKFKEYINNAIKKELDK